MVYMQNFFGVLFFISAFILLLGIIKPTLVIRWGIVRSRGRVFLIYGLSTFAFMFMIGVTAPELTPEQKQAKELAKQQETINTTVKLDEEKAKLAQEFKEKGQKSYKEAKEKEQAERNKPHPEFDVFYQDFQKYHSVIGKDLSDLKMALDKTSGGTINSVDFYNYLKSLQNVFLLAWSDIDKKTAPNDLNDAQKKEVNESIRFLSYSALSAKEAVEALMEGMNNPNSIEARSNFKTNIEKALTAHKVAGENMEKIKNDLSVKN
jgi:hypothetical protein